MKKQIIAVASGACFFANPLNGQGSLSPPGAPAPTQATLQQIYDRLGNLQSTVNAQSNTIQSLENQVGFLTAQLGATTAWQTTVIDATGSPGQPDFARAPNGNLGVAFIRQTTGHLCYAESLDEGSTWTVTVVDNRYTFRSPTVAFDSASRPRIAYGVADQTAIYYSSRGASAWSQFTVASDPSFRLTEFSLVMRVGDLPAITYRDALLDLTGYATLPNLLSTTWNFTTVEGPDGNGNSLTLVPPLNSPALAYARGTDLRYGVFNAGSWGAQTVTANGSLPHLVFSKTNSAGIAYYNLAEDSVRYAFIGGIGTWVTQIVHAPSGSQQPALAFNSANHPMVLVVDKPGNSSGPMHLHEYNGTSWVKSQQIASSVTEGTLETTASDVPMVVFQSLSPLSVRFARRGITP